MIAAQHSGRQSESKPRAVSQSARKDPVTGAMYVGRT